MPVGADVSKDEAGSSQNRAFELVHDNTPRFLFVGWDKRVSLDLENRGSLTWSRAERFAVSYAWLTRAGERVEGARGDRAHLPHPVSPGQGVAVVARLKPPGKAGIYVLRWDVVQERVQWFSSAIDHPKFERTVVVLPRLEYWLGFLLPTALAGVALFLVRRVRKKSPSTVAYGLATFSVVIWSAVSIVAKPQFLYVAMGFKMGRGSLWMNLAVAAAVLLFVGLLAFRWRPPVAWLLAAAATVMVWANILHFRFFRDVITVTSLMAAGQAAQLGEVVGFLTRRTDLMLFVDLLVALPLVGFILRMAPPSRRPSRTWRLMVILLLIAVVAVGMGKMWQLSDWTTRGRGPRVRTIRTVKRYGLYGFQAQDAMTQIRQRWFKPSLSEQEFSEIAQWFADRSPQRAGEGALFGAATGMNFLAIQVESAQQFIVGLEIDGQEITPNLNRWQQRAISFSRLQDQTGHGRSSAGEFVSWTSIVPVASSVAHQYPSNNYSTLAHELEREGYHTLSAVPFNRSFWNRHQTYPAYGFATGLFTRDFDRGQKIGWGLGDVDFFRQMAPRLLDLPRPFCAWMTTLSLHYPYEDFPVELRMLDLGTIEDTPFGNYLHGMHYFDQAFGELMGTLEAEGLLDSTVVALWGDHDSGLIRRGSSPAALEISSNWPEFHIRDRVPFMIWLPDSEQVAKSIDATAGQVDIAPTLMALFGLDPASFAFTGRNLLNGVVSTAPVVKPNGNWVSDSQMFLDTGDVLAQGACWDLRRVRQIPPSRCRDGYLEAQLQLEISEALLVYDLQERLSEWLSP
jgi:phosphoglycerol transferase MdoB-like AlkP superfamily enzyme